MAKLSLMASALAHLVFLCVRLVEESQEITSRFSQLLFDLRAFQHTYPSYHSFMAKYANRARAISLQRIGQKAQKRGEGTIDRRGKGGNATSAK